MVIYWGKYLLANKSQLANQVSKCTVCGLSMAEEHGRSVEQIIHIPSALPAAVSQQFDRLVKSPHQPCLARYRDFVPDSWNLALVHFFHKYFKQGEWLYVYHMWHHLIDYSQNYGTWIHVTWIHRALKKFLYVESVNKYCFQTKPNHWKSEWGMKISVKWWDLTITFSD